MTRFLAILLLFYSLSLIHTQQPSEYETVKPPFNQTTDLALSQAKLYRIDLVDRRTDLDLALLALAFRGTAPQIYASKNPDQLITPDQAPYSSKDMVGEVISIHSDYFADTQSLYVKLVCEASECHSTVTFDYSKELILNANGYRFYQRAEDLGRATLGIVRLQLPTVADAERIVIHAEAIPAANLPDIPQFDVLIEQGAKIPHTSRVSNIQRTAWFEGKTIVIPKDHPLFCPTCNYTLSLKLSEGIAISVSANVFGPNTPLTAAPILDGVQKEKYNSYVFNIRDPEDEFIIDVGVQHGNVTLYIDCGNNIQNNFFLYYWRYEVKPQEEIVLTPREHSKCQNAPYYIVVYGHEDSVYAIRGLWKPSSTLELRTGAQTIGDIFPGETITYELVVPIFIADEFMIDMEVSSEIDFKVNNCKFPSDCPGLIPAQMEATPTVDTLHKNDSEFKFDWVSVRDPDRRIIINPHTGGCYPILIQDRRFMDGPIPVCAYQVILHSTQQLPVEYRLKVLSRGHEWLYPGLSKADSLGEGEKRNYMLYVPHQGLSQVTIQITKFSGEVSVYVSMTEKYPNETTTNVKFSHEGMIVFKEPPLNGTYYITVQGEETSSYSISAFIEDKDGKMEDYALPLKESVPQKGVVLPKHEHPVMYYKILLDLDEEWKGSLRITLNPSRGSLVMVVNSNNIIPLPTISSWNTTSHHLEISSDDPLFTRNGVYHIGIYMDWSNQEALGWDDIPFTIVYYLQETIDGQVSNRKHLMLSSAVPFQGKIKKDEVKYFEVSISPRDTEVTIYKQADAGGVDLYISREPTNEYPGPDSYTYTTALTHTNSLTLDTFDIREICQESMVLVVCTFYMAVIPASDLAETSFSVYLKREFKNSQLTTKIALEDGKRLILDAPEDEENPTIFYFYPHSRQPSVVTVACPGKQISIYASKKNIEIGSSLEPEIEAPWADDPTSYSYSSKDNKVETIGLAHLTIPSQTEINATVVALAVYFKTLSNTSSEYSIVVSSQSTRIYTGQPYYGSVQNDSYVYFYFDVSKDDCNLLVALTTLDDGNPDLLVSYGENLRPTIGDSQFSSISDQRTEVIEVGNLDILPLKSMAGTWSIGVYGRTASSFTLTAIYEDQKTVELKSGIPFEMLLAENSKMYFKYYHEQNNSLEFKLERFSGDLEAYIINVDQNENFQPHLPNSTYYDWKIDAQYESTLKINPTDKDACTNCLYLIGLQTGAASKFVFNVLEDIKFVKLQNGIHHREEQEANSTRSYVFTSPNSDEIFMNLYLFGSELHVYSSHNPTLNTTNYDKVQNITQDVPSFQIAAGKGDFIEGQTIWDGTQFVPSEKNSFYFVFENPTDEPIKYNFIMRTHDTNIILRPGDRADTYLGGGNQTSWVFYSSYGNEVIKLLVDFHVQSEEAPEMIRDIALTGLPVEAKYWAEKETQGEGKVVDLDRAKVIDDLPTLNHIHNFRQVLTTISKKGKYVFNIANPFAGNMVLGVRLFRSEVGALTLDQNSEHSSSLAQGNKENLEIFLGNRGTWYLWVYSCAGEVELSVQDSSKELELESSAVILPQGQHHLFTAFHPRGGVKVVTVSKNPATKYETEYYMSSSYFYEGKVYDFEPDNDDYHAKVEYEEGTVQVSLTPVQFTELDADDTIIYSIKVCPFDENNKEQERNICGSSSVCLVNSQTFQVNLQQPSVNARFENVKEGNYYVKTVANIYHKDKLIRFVPYALKTLEAKAKSFLETGVESVKSSSKTGLILVGLVAVVVIAILGYWGYGKLKNFGGKTGVEMQNFPQKKQQYEAVEEEEQTIAEGGEVSQEKSEEEK